MDKAKFDYLLRQGDNALILSQQLSQLCGKGPALEEDMALTNVALDLLGQTRMWLGYAGELEAHASEELDHALQDSDRVLPHPVVSEAFDADRWWKNPPAARLLASEYMKFLVSWVRTRFEADPERSRAAILIGRGKPVKMVAEPLSMPSSYLSAASWPRLRCGSSRGLPKPG